MRLLVFVFVAIVIVEISVRAFYLALSAPLHASRFVWSPDYEQARKNWDALSLGVDEEIGGFRATGAKYNAEFPNNEPLCGSAYGDSYVGGAEVPDAEGWVEQLSHSLGCHLANYAVGNYGTDQAYWRFRQLDDESPIVLLGVNPNTVMDNVNQYDGFLGSPLEPYALKGRFVFDEFNHLKWVPRPRLDADGFVAMHRQPAKALPQSYFLPDTRDGPITLRFPYIITFARVALMPRVRNLLAGRAQWSSLYDANHPSGALSLMVAIIESFVELANSRGKRSLVVMLPLAASFTERANHGEFEYAPLVTALRERGIEIFDPGAAMIDALAGRSPCEFYTRPHPVMALLPFLLPCGGHYSRLGNTVVAQLVDAELRRRNLLKNRQ